MPFETLTVFLILKTKVYPSLRSGRNPRNLFAAYRTMTNAGSREQDFQFTKGTIGAVAQVSRTQPELNASKEPIIYIIIQISHSKPFTPNIRMYTSPTIIHMTAMTSASSKRVREKAKANRYYEQEVISGMTGVGNIK